MIDEKLIQKCQQNDRNAQRTLYENMAPKLYPVCKRYLNQDADINIALTDTFYLLFTKIEQLENPNALFGWAKKIAINACLGIIRKNKNFLPEEISDQLPLTENNVLQSIGEKDILGLLKHLPEGARAVFNLYVIEGYSHKEIATSLNVSEGTSKSQLNYAKTKLRALVNQFYYAKQN